MANPSTKKYKYKKVLDNRNRPIRGLWVRNGRYMARMTTEDPSSGKKSTNWIPLDDAETQAQAQAELRKLQTRREAENLPTPKRAPKFSDYVESYFSYLENVRDAKRPATIQKEKGALRLWKEHLGGLRLNQIKKVHINSFIEGRQKAGISGRTVNLDVIALRNVLKRAVDDEWITRLPTENLRPLKSSPKKRDLVTSEALEQLCEAARKHSRNGVEFADYVRLMALCGARRDEALRLTWEDVDWERGQLTVGADGLAKNRKARVVDFNADLAAHLVEMFGRRAPDSKFLFPSPQRGDEDRPVRTFKETLDVARRKVGVKDFGFHDCRHYFISHCVMSGIDYMTIARWVGHQDGGILIGQVYGHLSNEHAKRQAGRVNFE